MVCDCGDCKISVGFDNIVLERCFALVMAAATTQVAQGKRHYFGKKLF